MANWLVKHVNRILHFFGLMTIRQAKNINRENAALLTRTWSRWAERDFGAPINPNAEQQNREWSDDTFDEMLPYTDPATKLNGAWEER